MLGLGVGDLGFSAQLAVGWRCLAAAGAGCRRLVVGWVGGFGFSIFKFDMKRALVLGHQ